MKYQRLCMEMNDSIFRFLLQELRLSELFAKKIDVEK
jgi:hypothetical protein